MGILSRVHANNLVKGAKDKPNVFLLLADLTGSCEADLFRDTCPERFFQWEYQNKTCLYLLEALQEKDLCLWFMLFQFLYIEEL